jgi:phosphoribosyl-ATP pyrophosphohydrolase/phosphoribosyl-AMP cyclohydrolase
MELEKIQFDDNGLVPAVVQDSKTGEVLMLAYMNAESLARTLQTGETWFWSRSRQELWHKGATSGNTQRLVELRLDCDGDSIILRVEPAGPACHTGEHSCFFRPLAGEAPGSRAGGAGLLESESRAERAVSVVDVRSMEFGILVNELLAMIRLREAERPQKSYTAYLFDSGLDKILKKVGEEAAETIIAAKNGAPRELSSEIADLLYHLLVLMVERGIGIEDIYRELAGRVGKPANGKHFGNALREV